MPTIIIVSMHECVCVCLISILWAMDDFLDLVTYTCPFTGAQRCAVAAGLEHKTQLETEQILGMFPVPFSTVCVFPQVKTRYISFSRGIINEGLLLKVELFKV